MAPHWYQDRAVVVAAIGIVIAVLSASFTLWQVVEARAARIAAEHAAAEQRSQTEKAVDASQRSAQAAESSAYLAEKGMETSQRCWVLIKDLKEIHANMGELVPTQVKITIENSGPTPARVTKIEQYCRLLEVFKPFYDKQSSAKWNPGVLGPRQAVEMLVKVDKAGYNDDAYRFGAVKLCVWGTIEYRDVFEHRHLTQFAHIYDRETKTFGTADIHNTLFDLADPQPLG